MLEGEPRRAPCFNRGVSEPSYVDCPDCGTRTEIPRRKAFKRKCASGGAIAGAAAGAWAGSSVGVATGGTAFVATVPAGVIGGLVLGLGGKVGADWAAARVPCSHDGCETVIQL